MDTIDRRRAAIELAVFSALAFALRIAFDPLFWRFAGPVSLIATLACVAFYLHRRGEGWSSFGLIPLKGVKAKHDLRPKAGEKICPITLTKANPDFTWIVAGKSYEFCCPPCVDEFVTMAKTQSDQIMEPDFYIKKQK